MWVTAAMLVQVLLELDGFHTGSGSAARSHGSINTITLLDVNTITLLDVGLSRPHPDPPTWLAVQVCVGLANRDGSGHPPVYTLQSDNDAQWLSATTGMVNVANFSSSSPPPPPPPPPRTQDPTPSHAHTDMLHFRTGNVVLTGSFGAYRVLVRRHPVQRLNGGDHRHVGVSPALPRRRRDRGAQSAVCRPSAVRETAKKQPRTRPVTVPTGRLPRPTFHFDLF